MEFEMIRYVLLIPIFFLFLLTLPYFSDLLSFLFIIICVISTVILIYQIIIKTKEIFQSD